jgi:hypothetical protein
LIGQSTLTCAPSPWTFPRRGTAGWGRRAPCSATTWLPRSRPASPAFTTRLRGRSPPQISVEEKKPPQPPPPKEPRNEQPQNPRRSATRERETKPTASERAHSPRGPIPAAGSPPIPAARPPICSYRPNPAARRLLPSTTASSVG